VPGGRHSRPQDFTQVDHVAVRSHGLSPGKRFQAPYGYARIHTPGVGQTAVYPSNVILEVDTGAIRDLAAALNAARKREPSIEILAQLERKVLHAIQQRSTSIELAQDEAQALRNVLQRRAYDQRNTQEGTDYMDLADRITQDLETDEPPLITTESTNE
jgi:hypothetical protein